MWSTLTSNRVDVRCRRAEQSGERQRVDVQLPECCEGTRNGTTDAHCRRWLPFPHRATIHDGLAEPEPMKH